MEISGRADTRAERFMIRLGATFFFTGHFPIAPATFASFVTLLLWWRLPPISAPAMLWTLLILALYGTYVAGRAEAIYGHDGKPIVIDEVVGALLTVAFLGPAVEEHRLKLAIAGFLLFRVLDVVKPPPAYQLQSLPGGFGVMADDVMAAVYGNCLLRLVHLLRPGWI